VLDGTSGTWDEILSSVNQYSEIMKQPWPLLPKMVFGTSFPGKNHPEFLFLEPNLLVDAMIAQVSLKK
jgi:hypothetical protein